MPKAEVGSTKHIANRMKAKGLQRLRWYCQICAKQCRDENGFKQHTLSEGHVRAMLMVGEDPKKYINDYSRQFQRDFLQLLKTSHGEKKVYLNQFYQEYIRDKEHVHMNATKWPSLTEFAKFLGREGICRVEEGERGLEVAWVDDSPEAIRRREDIKKKDRLAKGDEDVESRLLEQQIRRAKEAAASKQGPPREEQQEQLVPAINGAEKTAEQEEHKPIEPVKLSGFSLKAKAPAAKQAAPSDDADESKPVAIESFSAADQTVLTPPPPPSVDPQTALPDNSAESASESVAAPAKISFGGGGLLKKSNAANPFAKKNPFAKPKPAIAAPPAEKRMSNLERIMKEELERKRQAEERGHGSGGNKRPRLG